MSSSSCLSDYIPLDIKSIEKIVNESSQDQVQVQNFHPLHRSTPCKCDDSDKECKSPKIKNVPTQPKGDSGFGASDDIFLQTDVSPKKSSATEESPLLSSGSPVSEEKRYFCHTCQKKMSDVLPHFACQYCQSTFVEEVKDAKVEISKNESAEVRVHCHNCQKNNFAILEEDLKCDFCQSEFLAEISDDETISRSKSQSACDPNALFTYICHSCDKSVDLPASSKLECPLCRKGALELVMNKQKSFIDHKIHELCDDEKLGVAAGGERDMNIMNVWNGQKKISKQTQKLQKNKNVKPANKYTVKAKIERTPTEDQRKFLHSQKQMMQNCQQLTELPGSDVGKSSNFNNKSRNVPQKSLFPPLPKPKKSLNNLLKNQQSLMNTCQKNVVPKLNTRPTPITRFNPIEQKTLNSFEQFTSTPKLPLRKTDDTLENLNKFESHKSKENGRYISIGSYLKQSTQSKTKKGKKDSPVKEIIGKKIQPIPNPIARGKGPEYDLGKELCKFYQQGICKWDKKCPLRHVDMFSPMDEIETVSLIDSSESSKLDDKYDEEEKNAFEYILSNKEIYSKSSSHLIKLENNSQCIMKEEQKITESNHQVDCESELVKSNDQLKTKDKVESLMLNKSSESVKNEQRVVQSNLTMEPQTNFSEKIGKSVEDSITGARSCQSIKNYEGAVYYAKEGLKHSCHNFELLQILTHGLMMTGKLNESLQVCTTWTELIDKTSTPEKERKARTETSYLMATIMTRLERTDDAIQTLENLLKEKPHDKKAKDKLVKLQKLTADNKMCEVYCSQAEQEMDDPKKAFQILNKALALPTSSRDMAFRILNLLGLVTVALGMFEEAEKHLTSILDLENWGGEWRLGTERMRNALVERGKCRSVLGKDNLASQDWKRAYINKLN